MNKNWIVGFMAGLSVGATVGMLCAPTSGVKLRRMVVRRTKDEAQNLKDQGKELLDTANGVIERGRAGIVSTQESVKAAVEAGKKAYQQATNA